MSTQKDHFHQLFIICVKALKSMIILEKIIPGTTYLLKIHKEILLCGSVQDDKLLLDFPMIGTHANGPRSYSPI